MRSHRLLGAQKAVGGFHVTSRRPCWCTHLQKNLNNELLLLCAPTWPSWPLSFESHRTEGHVNENHLYLCALALLNFQEENGSGKDRWLESGMSREMGSWRKDNRTGRETGMKGTGNGISR